MKGMGILLYLLTAIAAVFAETGYYVSADGDDANDGLTENSAFKTLDRGLAQTKTSGVKRIIVTGTLTLESEAPANQNAVFFVQTAENEEIVIAGNPAGGNPGVLQGTMNRRVLAIASGSVRLENILITGGNLATAGQGGGAYIGPGARLTAGSGAVIRGNRAFSGGGAYVDNGFFIMEADSILAENWAQTDGGGVAVHGSGAIDRKRAANAGVSLGEPGSAVIRGNARIEKNSADDDGGGVYSSGGVVIFAEKAKLLHNTSQCGGGLCSERSAFTVVQDKVLVQGNKALGRSQGGGGLCAGVGAGIVMKAGEVRGNSAYLGGGAYLEGGSFKLSGGAITGNEAGHGGGLYRSSGDFTATFGDLSGNRPNDIAGPNW
jgi:predicted outer membrane repeat protein